MVFRAHIARYTSPRCIFACIQVNWNAILGHNQYEYIPHYSDDVTERRTTNHMPNALVTGGAGFIGSHLVSQLVSRGIRVTVLDNLSSGDPQRLTRFGDSVTLLQGDIRDEEMCHRASRGVDCVFHMAAAISVPQSLEDPVGTEEINTKGTLNMLIACRDEGVGRFVLSSSAAVYGNAAVTPVNEEMLPLPESPYGLQKLCGEHYCRIFTKNFGVEAIALRYFNVYGPGQNPNSHYAAVVPRFITCLANNRPPTVYGDGGQTRDFCYVEDVALANIAAGFDAPGSAAGGVYNIGSGRSVSLIDLLDTLYKLNGKRIEPIHEAARAGDIRHSGADTRRAETVLGFKASFDLEKGLDPTLQYYLNRVD